MIETVKHSLKKLTLKISNDINSNFKLSSSYNSRISLVFVANRYSLAKFWRDEWNDDDETGSTI